MAQSMKVKWITLDGERHIRGDFCWCNATHIQDDNTNYHHLAFDKGQNAVTTGRDV